MRPRQARYQAALRPDSALPHHSRALFDSTATLIPCIYAGHTETIPNVSVGQFTKWSPALRIEHLFVLALLL